MLVSAFAARAGDRAVLCTPVAAAHHGDDRRWSGGLMRVRRYLVELTDRSWVMVLASHHQRDDDVDRFCVPAAEDTTGDPWHEVAVFGRRDVRRVERLVADFPDHGHRGG
jgi:hypothetical protein